MKKTYYLLILIAISTQNAFAANSPQYPEAAYGDYEVEGYYIKQETEIFGENYNEGYLIMADNNNQLLEDYFNYEINQGNTINSKTKDNKLKINLGCYSKDSVGTSWFKIDGNAYKILKSSHENKKIKINLTIGELPIADGPCLSLLKEAKALNVSKEVPGTFADVSSLHPNSEAVEMLYKSDFIKGYPDGTFGPDKNINRAELTKIIVAIIVGDPTKLKTVYYDCFSDVKRQWYAPYICYAKQMNWIKGYSDSTFKPGNTTNRVEAVKIILNAFYAGKIPDLTIENLKNLEMPTDASDSEWYYPFLKYAIGKNILDMQHTIYKNNDYKYEIGDSITRKEVVEMIFRLISL